MIIGFLSAKSTQLSITFMYTDHSISSFIYSKWDYLESLVRGVTPDDHPLAAAFIMVTKPIEPAPLSLMTRRVTQRRELSLLSVLSA